MTSHDLFASDFAEVMKKRAGKPYRPSNGTEGAMFQERFCEHCTKDSYDPETGGGELCPIIGDTMCFDVSDPEYPTEWVISERGQPVCTEFTPRAAITPTPDTTLSNGEHSRGGV